MRHQEAPEVAQVVDKTLPAPEDSNSHRAGFQKLYWLRLWLHLLR